MTDAPHADLMARLENHVAAWSDERAPVACPACGGSGEIHVNRSRNREPWNDETYDCPRCDGDGVLVEKP